MVARAVLRRRQKLPLRRPGFSHRRAAGCRPVSRPAPACQLERPPTADRVEEQESRQAGNGLCYIESGPRAEGGAKAETARTAGPCCSRKHDCKIAERASSSGRSLTPPRTISISKPGLFPSPRKEIHAIQGILIQVVAQRSRRRSHARQTYTHGGSSEQNQRTRQRA